LYVREFRELDHEGILAATGGRQNRGIALLSRHIQAVLPIH
jgi:hypothetical protein